jgi:hypothetical protein
MDSQRLLAAAATWFVQPGFTTIDDFSAIVVGSCCKSHRAVAAVTTESRRTPHDPLKLRTRTSTRTPTSANIEV